LSLRACFFTLDGKVDSAMSGFFWFTIVAQANSNAGLPDMVNRIVLFILGLLVFCFVCGFAWRTIPALRRILPTGEKAPPPDKSFHLSDELLDDDYPATRYQPQPLEENNPAADSGSPPQKRLRIND
jgi:hypothetical protein